MRHKRKTLLALLSLFSVSAFPHTLRLPVPGLVVSPGGGSSTSTAWLKNYSLLVPAYFYPGSGAATPGWDTLVSLSQSRSVGLAVVINPDSGPGVSIDSNYQQVVQALNSGSALTLGYVHLSWGSRPMSDVLADITAWSQMYPVRGLFLDEYPSTPSAAVQSNLNQLYSKAASLGLQVFANVGTAPSDVLLSGSGFADVFVDYEDVYANLAGNPQSTLAQSLRPSRLAALVSSIPGLQQTLLTLHATRNEGWLYLSSLAQDVSYDGGLPPEFGALVQAIQSGVLPA